MTPQQVAEILLVRAVEEAGAAAPSAEAQIDAFEAAGDLDDERAWFARRAAHLLAQELAPFRAILAVREAFAPGLAANLALPFLVGLASNYLGPRAQIHVVYNPIVFLVLWNLAVYAALLLQSVRPRRAAASRVVAAPARASEGSRRVPRGADAPPAAAPRLGGGWLGWLLRRSAARLWLRAHRSAVAAKQGALDWAAVGMRFFELWDRAAGSWFVLRTRRMLHRGALALALGAIAGMYVRGLFFQYEMVWRSTFVQEPERVAALLRILLGPACLLLQRPLPGVADAAALVTETGVGAAPWIHLHAATALLAVVLPRALLALQASWRLRRLGPSLELGLGDAYFAAILARAREIQVLRVRQDIEGAVRAECMRLAEGLARHVAESLYDARIVPRLAGFRERGGRIEALEEDVRAECTAFEPELSEHMEHAQRVFETDLTREVLARVGRRLALPAASTGRLGASVREIPGRSVGHVGGDLSGRLARDFGAAVTLAVAAVVGTLSGGFGSKLGAAILVTLLHTTGPVGFLLGAVAGALAALAALVAGRARVESTIRGVRLPAFAVRLALPSGRFDRVVAEGRQRCLRTVRELVAAKLDPLTDELADQVWARVKPLLAQPVSEGGAGARGLAAEPT